MSINIAIQYFGWKNTNKHEMYIPGPRNLFHSYDYRMLKYFVLFKRKIKQSVTLENSSPNFKFKSLYFIQHLEFKRIFKECDNTSIWLFRFSLDGNSFHTQKWNKYHSPRYFWCIKKYSIIIDILILFYGQMIWIAKHLRMQGEF